MDKSKYIKLYILKGNKTFTTLINTLQDIFSMLYYVIWLCKHNI